MNEDNRESRKWWAVAHDNVRQVTGYTCKPNNPDMWWCPEVGLTMSEGHHLFETESEALDKCIHELNGELERINRQLVDLISRKRGDEVATEKKV